MRLSTPRARSSGTRTGSGELGSKLGPESPIPDKLYFKIGEVSQLVGVRAHVLRYWEKEVPSIRPGKSASNQRRYRYKDVEIFREIRRLLHEERYTLAGARKRIMAGERNGKDDGAGEAALEGALLDPATMEPLSAERDRDTADRVALSLGPGLGGDDAGDDNGHETDDELDEQDSDDVELAAADDLTVMTTAFKRAQHKLDAERTAQLPLGFSKASVAERLERVRSGLRELIRLAGEEP